jgi:hypothetical protein
MFDITNGRLVSANKLTSADFYTIKPISLLTA